MTKEAYYLEWNKDNIFTDLIQSEVHLRNATPQDAEGFLNCVVKHTAHAEGEAEEAVSHSLMVQSEENKSEKFREFSENLHAFRKSIQKGDKDLSKLIKDIRLLRREFESFNPEYDVSRCSSCGINADAYNPRNERSLALTEALDRKDLNPIKENNESRGIRMVDPKLRDIAGDYGGMHLGEFAKRGLLWLDAKYPAGVMGLKPSLIGDLVGTVGGIYGGLKLKPPYDKVAVMVGGHLSTDLYRQAEILLAPAARFVYTPVPPGAPSFSPASVIPQAGSAGKYTMVA